MWCQRHWCKVVSSDSVFPFIPESWKGEKHTYQNLKSMSDSLDESGQVPLGRGWNCVFLLVFGPWAQILNIKTHPAPSFQLVCTPSAELPCPFRQGYKWSVLPGASPCPKPGRYGPGCLAVSPLWVLLPACGYPPPSAQGTVVSS